MKNKMLNLLTNQYSIFDKQYYETYNTTKDFKNFLRIRLKDISLIIDKLNKMSFEKMPSELMKCKSLLGTFFDGNGFYYSDDLLKLSDNQQLVAFLNDMFNVYQGFYNREKPRNEEFQSRNLSLLALYHIGLLPNTYRLNYGWKNRHVLYNNFINNNPNFEFKIFGLSKESAKYLYYDAIVNENNELVEIRDKIVSNNIIHCKASFRRMELSKSRGLIICFDNEVNVFYKPNELQRTRRKEDKEQFALIKKLAGINN